MYCRQKSGLKYLRDFDMPKHSLIDNIKHDFVNKN